MRGRCANLTILLIRVLDSLPMSYWRKFFVIMLLVLSLPVQSFAALSMKCETSHFMGEMTSAQDEHVSGSAHRHDMHVATTADARHLAHHPGDAHHAHACSTCASCCLGAGFPVGPTTATHADIAHSAVALPPTVNVASFLTSGIERPPRTFLV